MAWAVATLLIVSSLINGAIGVGAGYQLESEGVPQKTYLVPVLRYGPNNQRRDLRHTLALAKALGAGVVMTGFMRHYSDRANSVCFNETAPRYTPLERVLDRDAMDAFVPTITVEELKAQGWDGHLDALVQPRMGAWKWSDGYCTKYLEATGISNLKDNLPVVTVDSPLACEQSKIDTLRTKLKKFRVVGLQIVLLGYADRYDLEQEAQGPIRAGKDKAACHAIMHQANGVVHPAPWIRSLAQQYVQTLSKLDNTKYMAVHVRPYPDECLEGWEKGDFREVVLNKDCIAEHRTMHLRLGACVHEAFKRSGAQRVFVMTHPKALKSVQMMLMLNGIRDVEFLDLPGFAQLSGCPDPGSTFVAMVEEEIAVQSQLFIGTHTSSITHTIAYRRIGAGGGQADRYLETMACGVCTARQPTLAPHRHWHTVL